MLTSRIPDVLNSSDSIFFTLDESKRPPNIEDIHDENLDQKLALKYFKPWYAKNAKKEAWTKRLTWF